MNINLPKCSQILYDTNVITYYIISTKVTINGEEKDFKIPDFTDKSHELTKVLTENGKTIVALDLVLDELTDVRLANYVHGYCNSFEIKELLGVDEIEEDIEAHVFMKALQKLKKFLRNEWFQKLNYFPSDENIQKVRDFYISLDNTEEWKEHRKRKLRYDPPSKIDLALIWYSFDKKSTLVSNDTDITKFIPQLKEAGLYYEIIYLKEYI